MASKSRLNVAKSLGWPENLMGSGLFSFIGLTKAVDEVVGSLNVEL